MTGSFISSYEAELTGVAYLGLDESSTQADYWTLSELRAMELQSELEWIEWKINDLHTPGWRFAMACEDMSREEYDALSAAHDAKIGPVIAELRARRAWLEEELRATGVDLGRFSQYD